MTKTLIAALFFIVLFASCSSMKPVNTGTTPAKTNPAVKTTPTGQKKNDIKFLDEITTNPALAANIPNAKKEKPVTAPATTEITSNSNITSTETVSALQIKYAQLLNTEVEYVQTTQLLKSVDEWYGTRYRMGGTSKSGVDCSAFVQAVYLSAFGMAVPRTAYEQYKAAYHISATEIKEGDLVFFNTTGGVSHVGIYLRNNKFIHASSSRGVTVSDLFDPYYLKRFLGVGRMDSSLGTR